MMKETENMDIWLEGGLRGEQEHGYDKKDFGMLYPLELWKGRNNERVLAQLICANGFIT